MDLTPRAQKVSVITTAGSRKTRERMSIAFIAPADDEPHVPESPASAQLATRAFQLSASPRSLAGMAKNSYFEPTPHMPTAHNLSSIGSANDRVQEDVSSSRSTSPGQENSPPRSPTCRKRLPRPSYTEEQKFFIMHARIVQDKSWEDIEAQFVRIFSERSRGGLTSVYYRIRKIWGLEEVLKSGPQSFAGDREKVDHKALFLTRPFLHKIGYLS